jgi:membrane fusion protein, macrolide-specific efflux system
VVKGANFNNRIFEMYIGATFLYAQHSIMLSGKKKMQRKTRRYWVTGIVLVIIVLTGVWFILDFMKPKPVVYITVPVEKRDIQQTVSATGVLDAYKKVNIGAQVSGQLQSLKVSLGEKVKKGQLLAVIDPSVKENDLRNAESQLKNIEAQKVSKKALLKKYEFEYARQQEMNNSDAAAKADLESAEANLLSARADIEALDAQITQANISVDTARKNLGYTQILAPLDGVVVAVEAEVGQTLVSTQTAPTILILADVDTMTVKAEISEADVIKVKPGLSVYFNVLGEQDLKYNSIIRSVDPAPENITDTDIKAKTISSSAIYYNGQFDIKNPDHKLRIFMTAQVSIVLGEVKQVLAIPQSVLGNGIGDRFQVQVLNNGKAETRMIKTGFKDNVYIQVLEGLEEGAQVIVGDSAAAAASEKRSVMPGPLG